MCGGLGGYPMGLGFVLGVLLFLVVVGCRGLCL